MPKRDASYMLAQRDAIARAALSVLIEKGVYATSQRDICKAAGISNGALYTHFASTEEVIVAACAIDHHDAAARDPTRSWADYLAVYADTSTRRCGGQEAKRFRLSLQFVAELSQMERRPEGLSAIYAFYRSNLTSNLAALKEAGEVSLPFGLEKTTEIHMQLFSGAAYQRAADPELDVEVMTEALHLALAVTAGRPLATGAANAD